MIKFDVWFLHHGPARIAPIQRGVLVSVSYVIRVIEISELYSTYFIVCYVILIYIVHFVVQNCILVIIVC